MIARIIILLNIIGAASLGSLFFGEVVTTTMTVPSEIQAGKEFTVMVTVNKGTIESFSRFQQLLPAGLTAKPLSVANGDFRYEDKTIKLMWLRMPIETSLSFSYIVQVDQRLKGNFAIGGNFSYIESNERKSVDVTPASIRILPSPDIDPSMIVDIKDFERMTIPNLAPTQAAVSCIRQTPKLSSDKKEILVNVLVRKSDRGKFAKIEEQIPAGFIAESVDSKSGIFTFKNQTIKFLWMNLPPEDFFVVSYRLLPKPEAKTTTLKINGNFSFIDGSITKSVPIVEKNIDLTKITKEELDEIIAKSPNATSIAIVEAPLETAITDVLVAAETVSTPAIKTQETKSAEVQKAIAETTAVIAVEEKPNPIPLKKVVPKSAYDKLYLLEPETGVYFRVQLAAGHKPVRISIYFKKHNIREEIKREQHEGWYKYSIGSFTEYKEARDYRSKIWETTDIDDAFVSAYNEGARITVQEALMISNQKWYK